MTMRRALCFFFDAAELCALFAFVVGVACVARALAG
jgi:hypothetical protein